VVKAEKYGPFAVHKPWGAAHGWTLTHILSGYAVASLIPREKAFRLARRLVRLGLNWNFKDGEKVPRRIEKVARPIVMQERGY
jgi:hypothetical protein